MPYAQAFDFPEHLLYTSCLNPDEKKNYKTQCITTQKNFMGFDTITKLILIFL